MDDQSELFWVVDEGDNVIGSATRRESHAKGLINRSAHVIILDKTKRVYIQKRSKQKDMDAGFWEIGIGGHVSFKESYEQAARRELLEETGLEEKIFFVADVKYRNGKDRENQKFFYCTTSKKPRVSKDEASECEFVEYATLAKKKSRRVFTLHDRKLTLQVLKKLFEQKRF